MDNLGIYVHIPFCIQKCKYCDFNSYTDKNDIINRYVDSLMREIQLYKERLSNRIIDTVFLGGGTPSILSEKNLYRIINAIYDSYNVKKSSEITIECNPGTISLEQLTYLRGLGFNRLSIGLQSFNDNELEALGRIHDSEMFVNSFKTARKAGFNNINVDIMFSIPLQTPRTWSNTLDKLVSLEPEHVSCYSLTLEEGTPLYYEYEDNKYRRKSEEEDRDLYKRAVDFLTISGYNQYEISNFAKSGSECMHNIKYWTCNDYIGFGLGSHSFINNQRFFNVTSPESYIQHLSNNKLPVKKINALDKKDLKSEYIFLGLRMTRGIDLNLYHKKFNESFYKEYMNIVDKYCNLGLMKINNKRCFLTLEGVNLSNVIMAEFI